MYLAKIRDYKNTRELFYGFRKWMQKSSNAVKLVPHTSLTVPNCLQTIERERATMLGETVTVTRTHKQCCTQIN